MSDEMAKSHARDYRVKAKAAAARHALEELLDEPGSLNALGGTTLGMVHDLIDATRECERRIVRRWD